MTHDIKVFGGRYGLGSKEFKPRDVKAIIENMMLGTLHHNFTVGINDDVTGLSLATDSAFRIEPTEGNPRAAILYGIGSDGTVGAVKNIVKIVGENSDLYPQSYAVYDSKKSGGLTASHLRFWDRPIQAAYLVESADFISVSNFMIAQRFDVFSALAPGGSVMINTSLAPDAAFANLPREAQEHLIRMRARVYFLDANRAAAELKLGNRINTFIMLNFFNITKIIDPKIAAASAKDAIEKTYRKKGAEVVEANWAAVDRAAEFLHEFALPSSPSNFAPDFMPAMTADAPVRIAGVLGEAAAMKGDDLPVSAFQNYGQFPVGTARYEKRRISEKVASVDLEKCIQCGKCSMLCPHAAIRYNVVEANEQIANSKEQIKFVPIRTPELGADLLFTLNISPADCTGCTICVKDCPVNALHMIPAAQAFDAGQQIAFDAAIKLPGFPREKLNLNIPKHIEFLPHYFEFSGACAGCGETPYLKLMAHLFGDRMMIANATGCSSIYGGNLPTTPWCADENGRGPAWSNSLFEDNAEYGLGMRLALDQKRAALKSLLFEVFDDADDKIIESLFAEKDIAKQRENVEEVKRKLQGVKLPPCGGVAELSGEAASDAVGGINKNATMIPPTDAQKKRVDSPARGEFNSRIEQALSLLDSLVDKSVWIVGGDGWAYDIGYGGLDHVLHSGANVNILVLDTEGYSNTGGQQSKSTPFGAAMKFAVGGKERAKKDLGAIAMMSGAYVAQISLGANQAQAVRAFREAEAFNGPSIILAYSPCISHGYDLKNGTKHQQDLVNSGAWPLFRFNPALLEQGKNPMQIDSSAGADENIFREFIKTEGRFNAARGANKNFDKLVESALGNNEYRLELKKHIASFALLRNSPKENGEG